MSPWAEDTIKATAGAHMPLGRAVKEADGKETRETSRGGERPFCGLAVAPCGQEPGSEHTVDLLCLKL